MDGEIKVDGPKKKKNKVGAIAFMIGAGLVMVAAFIWIVKDPKNDITKDTGLEITKDVAAQQQSMKKNEEATVKSLNKIKDEVYSNPDGQNGEEEKESMWSKIIKSEDIKDRVKKSTEQKEKAEGLLSGITIPSADDEKNENINFSAPRVQKRVYRDKESFEVDKENRKLVRENPYVFSNHFRGARYFDGAGQSGGGSGTPGQPAKSENDEVNVAMDRLERIMDKSNLGGSSQQSLGLGGDVTVKYTPLPPVTVTMGEFIECAMMHRLVSDVQESPVNVVVTRDFIDADRQYVVIPSGTKILGKSQVVSYQGAKKLYVWFERMILPSGNNVPFPQNKSMGLDSEGVAGVSSSVDSHFFQKFGSALLIGVLDGLGGLAQNRVNQNSGMSYMIDQSSQNFSEITQQMFQQFQNIVPTITVNPGYRVFVYMSSTMNITPYARLTERSYR
jgi:type IV secretory pathway VirB10-like protein